MLHYELQPGYEIDVTDPHRVYFSTNREFARGFAGRIQVRDAQTGIIAQHGSLYEVEPLGEIAPDPDFLGSGVSWSASSARVVAVVEVDVDLDVYAVTERIGPYMTWSDGSPVYSRTGDYLLSPQQISANQHQSRLAALTPWTPVEYVNAWLLNVPTSDRPSPSTFPAVASIAAEGSDVIFRHIQRATRLQRLGIEFSHDHRSHLQEINDLVAGRTRVDVEDVRGVAIALHPDEGVVGVCVATASQFGPKLGLFLDTIVVADKWRRQGLGSVLLLTIQQLLPALPSFVVGHCDPQVSAFFAQAGFTALHAGTPLPIPIGDEPLILQTDPGQCWLYRQGPI